MVWVRLLFFVKLHKGLYETSALTRVKKVSIADGWA